MNTIAVLDSTIAASGRTDSATKEISSALNTLKQRSRGNSIVSGIGRLFDLTAAIESSSLPPTEMQQRSIEASVTEFSDIVAKLNDIQRRLSAAGQPTAAPVKPPI